MADEWLREIGLRVPDAIAGFAGGVVNAFVFRKSDPLAIIGSVVVGAITANYMTEWAARYLAALSLTQSAAGFIVGLAGMAICQGIVEAFRKWKLHIGRGPDV